MKENDNLAEFEFVENKRIALQQEKNKIFLGKGVSVYLRWWDPELFTISEVVEVEAGKQNTIDEMVSSALKLLGIEFSAFIEGFKIDNSFGMYFNKLNTLKVKV